MSDMKVDPTRAKALVSALQSVSERVAKAGGGRSVRFHFSTAHSCDFESDDHIDVVL
jgi:hypothetical protein